MRGDTISWINCKLVFNLKPYIIYLLFVIFSTVTVLAGFITIVMGGGWWPMRLMVLTLSTRGVGEVSTKWVKSNRCREKKSVITMVIGQYMSPEPITNHLSFLIKGPIYSKSFKNISNIELYCFQARFLHFQLNKSPNCRSYCDFQPGHIMTEEIHIRRRGYL